MPAKKTSRTAAKKALKKQKSFEESLWDTANKLCGVDCLIALPGIQDIFTPDKTYPAMKVRELAEMNGADTLKGASNE